MDQYCALVLVWLFNPLIKYLRRIHGVMPMREWTWHALWNPL